MNAIARMLSTLALVATAFAASAQAPAGAPAADQAAGQARPLRVMLVGNSLTYSNNLPRLLRAVAASQPGGPAIETATYVMPGAELDTLWDDSKAADALRAGPWDALVLQERGGLVRCMANNRREPECRRSERAHRDFTRLATGAGARVLLLATWPPLRASDLGDNDLRRRMREVYSEAYSQLASRLGGDGARVEVVAAASVLLAPKQGAADPHPFSDDMHPSIASSLVMAAQLYSAITGRAPVAQDLLIDFPMLPPAALTHPDTPIETQPQLAGDGSKVLLKAEALAPLYARAAGG